MARHREPLPRLNINPTLNMQQPIGMGYGGQQAMFSPALPTSLQQSFHPPFPMNNAMHTPMQPSFFPQPPPAPGRPGHHQNHASVAHLAAAGIHPPAGFPITPLGGHFPRASMVGIPGQPSGHPFPGRNRRQLSIGGPPKAVLGGPARKLSPLPTVNATASAVPPQKVKKIVVKLPQETIAGADNEPLVRQSWARTPLLPSEWQDQEVPPVETTSAESFPPDDWRRHTPNTLDVFLPGKRAWEDMKQKDIEEKLEKLGVERGSGSSIPHIHAPHARAASISSPADPQLLLFKLNKLQQSQETVSGYNSLTPSPNPPFGMISPNNPSSRFLTNRHGHTMSLANMPMHPFFDPAATTTFDPFGPHVDVLSPTEESIHAPQGRVPTNVSSLALPTGASRPASRPDFTLGFGLDIPEEEEEEAIPPVSEERGLADHGEANDADASLDMDLDEASEEQRFDGAAVASQSIPHSRHVSKISAALSIRSADALDNRFEEVEDDLASPENPALAEDNGPQDMDLEDVVGEWTGSEDVYLETSEGEESIGEYSNPSDEEKARQERLERRVRRRTSQIDQPRRLPNFPRPPDNAMSMPLRMGDDIISNPSEEGQIRQSYLDVDYISRPPSTMSGSGRPLPPLPHSRMGSGQHTIHDPAHAHSRSPSDQFVYPAQQHQQPSFAPRRDSLNPFAKPFVFGSSRDSSSFGQGSFGGVQTPPKAPLMSHTRLPSIGKPLNVAAPEFKPTGFTFRPPPGVPQMPVAPTLDVPRPLPEVPSTDTSPFKVQGREKRQRRGSTASMEEGDSMTSFRFPANPESPQSIRHAPATSTSRGHKLNPSAEPFTFAGFSAIANLPYVPHESDPPAEDIRRVSSPEETLNDESTAKAENGEPKIEGFNLPSSSRPKRAPIPLDFKHPVSSNTVPAGLFKALNNGDERTRRTVRSRLSSREIFEHVQRPSMDDLYVPTISHKISRGRLVTDPGQGRSPPEDFFGSTRHSRRRSSLPEALHDDAVSTASENPSNPAMDLTSRMAMHQYEEKIESVLEEGLSALRHDLRRETNGQHAATQAMISEIQSLFRTQLRDSAVRSLEDSQMDARGELDFQLFRDIVEEGNKELITTLKHDLHELRQQVRQARASASDINDIAPVVEQLGSRTINAVVEAISELSVRQEAIMRVMPSRDRDATVDNLMAVLTPVLNSLRNEPIDYEFLTSQLTQAVKPHISQLIDLASDKRETASLIVDRILPMLPSRQTPVIDTDALTLQLTTEVRRAIAPIDAFEIKEQVADLVVERLDSRLAVRDKAFNIESLSGKIVDGVARLVQPLEKMTSSVEQIAASQEALSTRQSEMQSGHKHLVEVVSQVPSKILEKLESLKTAHADLAAKLEKPAPVVPKPDETLLHVKSAVDNIADGQKALLLHSEDLQSLREDIIRKLNSIPDSVLTATNVLQSSHAELLSSRDASKREMDELRKLNIDYQIQLTKARGAHGQVRVEKDIINEKLSGMEADRERLRTQVKELSTSNVGQAEQITTLETRKTELEAALAQALARLQASDVATQTNQDRINELEKANREVTSDRQSLKTKVDSLELQVTFANRDKESAVQALSNLQAQNDHLVSQQPHWDDLRQASEKIELLSSLIGQTNNTELQELRRNRDRTKLLEGENAALQKRLKEHENKLANTERAALTARQSLAQAQQRSSEWERRAKEYESQLDHMQTKLDQTEESQAQLDADYSLVKLQLEEREADDRLSKNQQSQLREQISALESKVTRLQSELEQAKTVKTPVTPTPYRNPPNGTTHPLPRPDSRASITYSARSITPHMSVQPHTSSAKSNTPPQPSVWDSMHAPTNDSYKQSAPRPTNGRYPNLGPSTPRARRPQYYRPAVPSPTPSTISLAPTQGDDGWWT